MEARSLPALTHSFWWIEFNRHIPSLTVDHPERTAGVGGPTKPRAGAPRLVALVRVVRVWNSVQTGTYGTGMDRSIKISARFDL